MASLPFLFVLACWVPSSQAFSVITAQERRHGWPLRSSVIKSEDIDFEFDEGAGGVRLAEESVIKVTGQVKHKPGKADPRLRDLLRYDRLNAVEEASVAAAGCEILGTGRGAELYKDPGETVEAQVTLAPHDAVRDCLMGVGSCQDYESVALNFCGGSDAQVLEVLDAVRELVLDLDVKTKAQIAFHSISHSQFPDGKSYLTVVALPEDASTGGLKGVERSLAAGEVYFVDGQYWTVSEDDRNNAVA